METKAGDPGAFARFDLNRVPTPAFVVDEVAIRRNLSILADIKARSGAKILSAMKAFSMWELAPVISEYLDVTDAFYDRREKGFVNGLLDAVAKEVRS